LRHRARWKRTRTGSILRQEGEIASGRTDRKGWVLGEQPSCTGSRGRRRSAVRRTCAKQCAGANRAAEKRTSREPRTIKCKARAPHFRVPTSFGHVFYAKHGDERDHAKMDPVGWHNRPNGRTGARRRWYGGITE
jgi:hypothetical protein